LEFIFQEGEYFYQEVERHLEQDLIQIARSNVMYGPALSLEDNEKNRSFLKPACRFYVAFRSTSPFIETATVRDHPKNCTNGQ
jgi:hypothetical protein